MGRFSLSFYDALLRGQRFIDAVAEARARALESGGNTWAAYQCYGDPDWVFTRTKKVKGAAQPRADEFDYIASLPALELALDTIIVQSTYQGADAESQRARSRTLEERFQRMKWTATQVHVLARLDEKTIVDWEGKRSELEHRFFAPDAGSPGW